MRCLVFAALTFVTCTAHAQKVCADPAQPCGIFKDNDLSFPLPKQIVAPELKSAPFFAVILRTAERCSIKQAEQQAAQALFPRNKVFYTRFECDDDVENNVTYTNVNEKFGFLAVYAGDDRPAAEEFLAKVKASGRFPGANLRRMQVTFVSP
jgi:hypothetical protein